MERKSPDLIAEIYYLTTEEGGRRSYAVSGYRPQFVFEGIVSQTSGEHFFLNKEKVYPGESVISEMRLVSPHYFYNCLSVGAHFSCFEGAHLVAKGKILEICNSKLLK